jgi:O-antigen/teichoic acid export membrane protein
MSESIKNKTVKGIIWSSIERFSVQSVTFFVLIFMARLLTPSDYGLVGMISVFISVSQAIIDGGFSEALMRKLNRTDSDCSTIFYFNIIVGSTLYALLYYFAPIISIFYKEPKLILLIRVIGLGLIINSFSLVQRTLLTIHLNFKIQAKISFSSAVVSGILGIYLAYIGWGVWAIVFQQLISSLVSSALLWINSKWYPKLIYSWTSLKSMFSFGSKLLAANLCAILNSEIYSLTIGKMFSASILGYYSRANQFASFPSSNLTSIMQRVTYPVLCRIANDEDYLSLTYRRFLRVSAFIIFPLMMILTAIAEPLILVLLKEKWLFAANLLQILCLSMMWYPIQAINLNLLKVKGRSDLLLRLEIFKTILGIIILCISLPMGIKAVCWGLFFSSMIRLLINTYYTGKLINIGYTRQMLDLLPISFLSLITGIIVYITIIGSDLNPLFQLIIGCLFGSVFYLSVAKVFRYSELDDILSAFHIKEM